MRYTPVITAVAVLSLASQSALAAPSKEENIGIGSGAVVGALVGGPLGFIVGASFGAKLGDTLHKKNDRIDTLQVDLDASRRNVAKLERGVDDLSVQIAQLENLARPQLISLMQAGIDMDLLFRTDEFALTETTGERLAELAGTVASMPDVKIQLDGFADERGDAEYNHGLSKRRVEFVRNLFIDAGVHPTRIKAAAHGEAVAQAKDSDSFALERRVRVKLFLDETQSVAANPR